MARRDRLVDRFVALLGEDLVTVVDRLDGWPGIVNIRLPDGDLLISIHLGIVGLSHRGRDAVERRFQNPGQDRPVRAIGNSLPLLVGIWDQGERPVLVGMEAVARLGKATRQSLFIPLWLLDHAARFGWAQHNSGTGEIIVAFHPALFPTYVEMRRAGLRIPPDQVVGLVDASGLTTPEENAAERVRRASSVLVRNARFSRNVVDAYDGLCAMCGLDFGLVEGAHIYPVQAPKSPDAVWNGLALCGNHHSAFDRHLLWVNPGTLEIKLHSKIFANAAESQAGKIFVESTHRILHRPMDEANAPRPEMFDQRYEFFEDRYSWVI